MRPASQFLQRTFDQIAPWLTLSLLGLYTIANFYAIPYTGLYFSEASGRVVSVYVPGPVQEGDVLSEVSGVAFRDFQRGVRRLPFFTVPPGEPVTLVVQRDSQTQTLTWVIPGFNWSEFFHIRLTNQWPLAYGFWLIGTFALLQLRPRRGIRRLFAAFCFLSAVWIIASTVSRWHIWLSPQVLRSAVWLSVPVYWHLHWVFPLPLRPVPRWVGTTLYGLFGLAAGMEWIWPLPRVAYAAALLAAAAVSLILLLLHLWRQPATRRASLTLLAGASLSLVPAGILAISATLFGLGSEVTLGGLLGLPLLPVAYLFAIYRHRFGGLELRVNRAISLYAYLLVLLIVFALAGAVLERWTGGEHDGTILVLVAGAGLVAAVASLVGYGSFQRFIERRLLGMPLAPSHLLQTYSARITTTLDTGDLIHCLRDEVLASLLVRQSALLSLEGAAPVVYGDGVTAEELPTEDRITALLADAGRYRPPDETFPVPWARLILALTVARRPIGVWLLGRRDPDDFYAASEIPILQALADQTAVALTNIVQAEYLHTLYQADMNRAEIERSSLARELHDGPLNDLGALLHQVDGDRVPPGFVPGFGRAIANLRDVISGLRPTMLDYGLHAALKALVNDLAAQAPPGLTVTFEMEPTPVRYDGQVETHAFRIAQQACANAMRYAAARTIRVQGLLEPERLTLSIEDDGAGFATGTNLVELIRERHFGLAGMHERAALMGAHLHIESAVGRGTPHSAELERAAASSGLSLSCQGTKNCDYCSAGRPVRGWRKRATSCADVRKSVGVGGHWCRPAQGTCCLESGP